MVFKTKRELGTFAMKIQSKLYDLHALCYSDNSNDIFDAENDCLIDQIECFNQYVLNNLNEEFRDYTAKELIESYEDELNKNWEMCLQIEKYFQAVTQTKRPDYIYA